MNLDGNYANYNERLAVDMMGALINVPNKKAEMAFKEAYNELQNLQEGSPERIERFVRAYMDHCGLVENLCVKAGLTPRDLGTDSDMKATLEKFYSSADEALKSVDSRTCSLDKAASLFVNCLKVSSITKPVLKASRRLSEGSRSNSSPQTTEPSSRGSTTPSPKSLSSSESQESLERKSSEEDLFKDW